MQHYSFLPRQGVLTRPCARGEFPDALLPLRASWGCFDSMCLALRAQHIPLRMTGIEVHFTSTVSVFVVSFPRMSITFTTTV